MKEDSIVVAALKEKSLIAGGRVPLGLLVVLLLGLLVVLLLGLLVFLPLGLLLYYSNLSLLLWYSNKPNGRRQEPAVGLIAPLLESKNNLPQPLLDGALNKEDAMNMVGHELEAQHANLLMIAGYVAPGLTHSLPQRRRLHMRPSCCSTFRTNVPHQLTQQWPTPFHGNRNHVDTSLMVIVIHGTPFHRRPQ